MSESDNKKNIFTENMDDILDLDDMSDDDMVVIMEDEEGNEHYYHEEMIIPIEDKRFAILLPAYEEEGNEDEDSIYIARIDSGENGDEVYVDPTDEEFEQVRNEYEKLFDEE